MTSVPPPSAAPPTDPGSGPISGPAPEPDADAGSWRAWMAPAAIALGFALGLVGTAVVGIVASVAGGASLAHPTPAVSLAEDLVFDLSFVAAALYLAATRGTLRLSEFGFRRVSLKTAVIAIAAAAIGYYVITAIYASLVRLHGSDKLPSELGVSKSTAALVGAAIFVCVIAPIAEELFFRGFIFGALRRLRITVAGRELGTWVAAIVTGILFGLAHTGSASSQYLLPLGFLGFVLCLIRWRTRSLYPCMALHSANNALALGINQLHWNAGEIIALILGALVVVGAVTAPLSSPRLRPA